MKSELEKMLSGEEYDSRDPVLFQMRMLYSRGPRTSKSPTP